MIVQNTTSRTASGMVFFLGLSFFISGILALVLQKWGIASVQLLIAGFLFFSYSGVEIDTEKHIFRNFNMYFGIIKTGKWKPVNKYIGLTLVPLKTVSRTYSRSNRSISNTTIEFAIYLVNKQKKPALLIKKCKTLEKGRNSLDEFAIWLKMPVYSPKR